uniref:Uncharacterized protein n=1 Tax=Romanomermis culicivorax TaxID=13658 RepID=A0A915KK69_ROMCU
MGSRLVLILSTIFALVGIVLVALAFGTNNWQEYKVDRSKILPALATNEQVRRANRSDIYFDRTYGLFRKCFPTQLPDVLILRKISKETEYKTCVSFNGFLFFSDEFTNCNFIFYIHGNSTDYLPFEVEPMFSLEGTNSYYDPFGQNCVNIKDYRIGTDDSRSYDSLSDDEKTRMHLMRTCVAFYIIGLAFLFFCLLCGVCGCWRRSASLILSTGILLLFATLFLAAAMAVWHGVDYMQREVIEQPGFYKTWEPILRSNTDISYGWSYIVAWVGICCILIASILMLAAYRILKKTLYYRKKLNFFVIMGKAKMIKTLCLVTVDLDKTASEEERDEFEKKRAPYMMTNYYDNKNAMVSPYNYQTYGYAYPGYNYPAYAQQQGAGAAGTGYYGYLTYGR